MPNNVPTLCVRPRQVLAGQAARTRPTHPAGVGRTGVEQRGIRSDAARSAWIGKPPGRGSVCQACKPADRSHDCASGHRCDQPSAQSSCSRRPKLAEQRTLEPTKHGSAPCAASAIHELQAADGYLAHENTPPRGLGGPAPNIQRTPRLPARWLAAPMLLLRTGAGGGSAPDGARR